MFANMVRSKLIRSNYVLSYYISKCHIKLVIFRIIMKHRKQPKITFPTQVSSAKTENWAKYQAPRECFLNSRLAEFSFQSYFRALKHDLNQDWSNSRLVQRSLTGAGAKVKNSKLTKSLLEGCRFRDSRLSAWLCSLQWFQGGKSTEQDSWKRKQHFN